MFCAILDDLPQDKRMSGMKKFILPPVNSKGVLSHSAFIRVSQNPGLMYTKKNVAQVEKDGARNEPSRRLTVGMWSNNELL